MSDFVTLLVSPCQKSEFVGLAARLPGSRCSDPVSRWFFLDLPGLPWFSLRFARFSLLISGFPVFALVPSPFSESSLGFSCFSPCFESVFPILVVF